MGRSDSRPCWLVRASWRSRPTISWRLAAVVKRHGGLFSSHIRNEGTDVLAAVKEAIDIGRRARISGRHHPLEDRRPDLCGTA